jgi:hypothetical protein
MLASAETHARQQQRLTSAALAASRRAWRLGNPASLLPALTLLQGYAAQGGVASVADMLAEQNIDVQPQGQVNTNRFTGIASDGRPLRSLLEQASTGAGLDLMAITQVADAFRVAAGVAITARPRVGWTRMISPPCCPRCAILAGKFFRWNQGFQRHPACRCRHIPTTEDRDGDVRTDPAELFKQGQVRGVTQAEQKAIDQGADINQVINSRRSLYVDDAGTRLTRESTTRRGGGRGVNGVRLTPEQIYRDADGDRDEALRLLMQHGYLTT